MLKYFDIVLKEIELVKKSSFHSGHFNVNAVVYQSKRFVLIYAVEELHFHLIPFLWTHHFDL